GTTNKPFIEELCVDPAIAVATKVLAKNLLNSIADDAVARYGRGRGGGMVIAAPGNAENFADWSDRVPGVTVDLIDHFAELCGLLVPRIIAAFFKMSFSMRSWAFSRCSARRSSAPEPSPTARVPPLPTCVPRFQR